MNNDASYRCLIDPAWRWTPLWGKVPGSQQLLQISAADREMDKTQSGVRNSSPFISRVAAARLVESSLVKLDEVGASTTHLAATDV